jgi:hypothetical protein
LAVTLIAEVYRRPELPPRAIDGGTIGVMTSGPSV